MIETTLSGPFVADLLRSLPPSLSGLTESARMGDARQPIHVVYGGAHLYRADAAQKMGATALRMLDEYAEDGPTFLAALGLPPSDAVWNDPDGSQLRTRVREKLSREAVEDQRVDFEDGYGLRPDAEEDEHAQKAGQELARGLQKGILPRHIGIRVKSLGPHTAARSLRTLDVCLTALLDASGAELPPRFVVTLPKVTAPFEVATLDHALDEIEAQRGLPHGRILMELMVETPASLVNDEGAWALKSLVSAGGGRVVGAHFGAYDYTAACGVAAPDQVMGHPACDFARSVMQVSLAGTGVWLADGATTTLPIAVHKAPQEGTLGAAAKAENRAAIHEAWRLHGANVRESLRRGFFQSWDLHPGQLVARYGATYAYFLAAAPAMGARLGNFVDRATHASRVGTVFDDAATGQGLLNFFLRAVASGALTAAEATKLTGVAPEDLRSGSFPRILARKSASDR